MTQLTINDPGSTAMDEAEPTHDTPCSRRRLHLSDLLLLVAATAAAAAVWRVRGGTDIGTRASRQGPAGWLMQPIWDTLGYIVPLFTAWAWAVLVMCWRSPRRPLREWARQPGFLAALIVTVASIQPLIFAVLVAVKRGKPPIAVHMFVTSLSPPIVGCSVLVGWATLWLTQNWRSEPDWPDRLGRAIGAGWIVAWLLEWTTLYAGLLA